MPKTIRREKLAFDDAEALQALCGSNNTRLKLIERTAGAQVNLRGNEITIEGDEAATETAKAALEQLYDLALAGNQLSSDDVVRAVKLLQGGDPQGAIARVFNDTILTPRVGRPIAPKGAQQKAYVDLVRANDIVFAIGPAGTGKTYLAMALAVRALLDKQVRRIILTRPAVEADKLERMMSDGMIEVAPLAFLRGRTLNDAFTILDEAQNTTPEQMKMFLTRMGFGSKVVVTGDITQTDLPRGQASGLRDALGLVEGIRGIGTVQFSDADVVRHPLVAALIRAYDSRDRARFEAREREARPPKDGPETSGHGVDSR